MAKFDIPRFRYLFQDFFGEIQACTRKPTPHERECYECINGGEYTFERECYEWRNGGEYTFIEYGKKNQNWKDTLIDLDVDDYEFEDGILRRIEK